MSDPAVFLTPAGRIAMDQKCEKVLACKCTGLPCVACEGGIAAAVYSMTGVFQNAFCTHCTDLDFVAHFAAFFSNNVPNKSCGWLINTYLTDGVVVCPNVGGQSGAQGSMLITDNGDGTLTYDVSFAFQCAPAQSQTVHYSFTTAPGDQDCLENRTLTKVSETNAGVGCVLPDTIVIGPL